jgi:DNA invertase Pin-like site-specific DNA recombinase
LSKTTPTKRGYKQQEPARSSNGRRRAIGYIRVSREGGRSKKHNGEAYRTKEMQRARIEELARQHNLVIVAWYVDENESGKDTKRPAFQEALAALKAEEAEVLVVAKLSRFARSVQDTEETVKTLDGYEPSVTLICGDLPEMTGPWGKAFRQIMAIFAELELELAREAWDEARQEALADGIYLGQTPPGYVKDEHRRLQVNPPVASLVKQAFLSRSNRVSWAEMLREWHEAGGPDISRSGLATVIKSRVYLGEILVEGEWIPGPHEAILTVEEYEAAQAVKAPRPSRSPKGEGAMLSGVMTCSSCGGKMTNGGSNYRCTPTRAGHKADCPRRMAIAHTWADQAVEEALLAWAGDLAAEGTANGESLTAAVQALEEAKAELGSFVEFTPARSEGYKRGLDSRQAAVDDTQAVVDRIKSERKVETVRVRLADLWPDLSTEERRRLLTQAVESITVLPPTGKGLGGANSRVTDADRLAGAKARLDIQFKKDALG